MPDSPDVISGLDPDQSAAVVAPRGPVCILAGAGTGKTRTITHRIAQLIRTGHVAPGQVLAVTFTARAAGEMRSRLQNLGMGGAASQVQARTFHAAALRQLRYFWPRVIGNTGWELIDRKFPLVAQAAGRAGVATNTDSVRDLAGEIEWAKASLISPDEYAAAAARHKRDLPHDAAKIADVYWGYEALKTGRDGGMLLDFDDLLIYTYAALEDHPAVAQEFRDRYRCFVVDEYQDVTPLQQRVLDAWLGDRDDLTVVGDANQTIYSFTGATPSYLLDFTRRFPEATMVRLERDYRSTPEVVALANRVIGAARGRIAGTRLQLSGQRPSGPAPVFAEYDDEPAEAKAVAAAIGALLEQGVPAAQIAILYRINAQSEVFETALTEAGIPYQIRGGEGFYQRREVREAISALRAAAARTDLPPDANLVTVVQAVLAPIGLTAAEPSGAQARERWASLTALVQLAGEYAELHDGGLAGLLGELAARVEARHPPVVQGVTLASLHAAKGLEWDAVFLAGLADGTLPISHVFGEGGAVADEAALEEERRLLYVGVTRAREHLHLSWALARTPGGRRSRRRSRFLYSLVPADSPAAQLTLAPRRKQAKCLVCGALLADPAEVKARRCAGCAPELDPELLDALKEWRLKTSRELGKPAFVVFTDAALVALASDRPVDDGGLVAINGIGAQKLQQFGPAVLGIIRDHLQAENSAKPQVKK